MQLLSCAMFIFVGIAIILNIQDEITGSHTSDFINLVGWCLVPIIGVITFYAYIKCIKHKTMKT